MTRVLVHAGFHKTGTTSLQKYLAQNRAALAPYFDYYGQDDFKSAGARARIYAQKPFIWRRHRFRGTFQRFLSGIPEAEQIVLSRETFSGVMPGHRDWRGRTLQDFRHAAIPLCRDVADGLRRRFGRSCEVEFLFTTRDQESWIRSVYGHLVRSIHLTESFEEFRALFPRLIDLDEEAATISKALTPRKVHVARLEDLQTRKEGPAAAVLDLMAVPDEIRGTLPEASRANQRQTEDLEAEIMALNRSGLSKDRLKIKKEILLRGKRQ